MKTIKELKDFFRKDLKNYKQYFEEYQKKNTLYIRKIYGKKLILTNINRDTKKFYNNFLNFLNNNFKLIKIQSITHEISGTTETTYKIPKNLEDNYQIVKQIREKFIENGLNQVKIAYFDETQEVSYISSKVDTKQNITEKKILDLFSNDDVYQDHIIGDIIIINMPYLSGGCCDTLCDFLKDRNGFIQIKNDDDLCGQRCLVLAEISSKHQAEYLNGKKNIIPKLKKMCDKLGVYGKMEITDFEKYTDKQIYIVSNNNIIYKTDNDNDKYICIYWDSENNHYHLINNINTFIDKEWNYRVCLKCNELGKIKKYRYGVQFNNHKCIGEKCKCCHSTQPCIKKFEENAICENCNMFCLSKECLKRHQTAMITKNKPLCNGDSWKCRGCKKWVDKKRYFNKEHNCKEYKCKNCGNFVLEGHRCFLQKKDTIQKPAKNVWVFDFESIINTDNTHTVNLGISENIDTDERKISKNIEDFVRWCLSLKNTILIAHNGKAYDTWMIHQYIVKFTGERPSKLILAGNKIMKMKVGSITFIDSINHIATSLEGLPKMFGIKELKKGFYPYKFNTLENQGYIGKIPDIKYYEPDRMKTEKRKEFFNWYKQQKGKVWDLQKETLEYCISDVVLLKEAIKIYRKNAIEFNSGIDPLNHPTIASYCMKVYTTLHMKPDTIPVLTQTEYDFIKRSFFGGRTEVFNTYKKWDLKKDPSKYGRYIDVQSLYPFVQYYKSMPVGIPKWSKNFDFEKDFGFVEVDIECPKKLFIPVLPEKKDGKLKFDLVNKINAVYTSVELKEAMNMGYKITKIHNSLIFEQDCNLFKSYIRNLLKKKVESSGLPKNINIQEFIEEHKKRFDIDLDEKNLIFNPGMRALTKIELNALWGKFGMRNNLSSTEYFDTKNIEKYWKLRQRHDNKEIQMKNIKIIDPETKYIEYTELLEENTSLSITNLAIASFTTSHARLRLYDDLKMLGDRAIYADTDSIIYEHQENNWNPKQGNYLGEMECETGGKPLTEVVAVAPKSYSYRYFDKKKIESTKFKGFSLNHMNSKKINFNSIKKLLDNDIQKIKTKNLNFKKANGVISTNIEKKEASFNFDKRVKTEEYITYPFGY